MNVVSDMAAFGSHRPILGLQVCDLDWPEAFTYVSTLADLPVGQTVVSFLNVQNANLMLEDPAYREVLSRHLVLPDGAGADVASLAIHGSTFPANLRGAEFVPALLTYMTKPKKVGLVGGHPEVLERARDAFAAHAPWHEFVAIQDGVFSEADSDAVADRIARHEVDILLIAMGTPKQEMWIDRHIRPAHARLVFGVGTLFHVMTGELDPVSESSRNICVEWLHQFRMEPRRLWSRYFVAGPKFLSRIARFLAGETTATLRRSAGGRKRLPSG